MDFVKSIDNVYNDSKKAIQDADGKLLLTHSGEMNSDTISELSEKAESKLFEINAAKKNIKNIRLRWYCLLYTSDAADE